MRRTTSNSRKPAAHQMANSCLLFNHSSPPQSSIIPSLQSSCRMSTSSPSLPTTINNHKLLFTMGRCTWQGETPFLRCHCPSGSCASRLSDVTDQAQCEKCLHPMNLHLDYSTPLSSCPSLPPSQVTKPIAIGPHVIHRDELIDEVITRLQFFHLVRVRGTPASGKTTIVHLLANKLLERDPETPLYILYGWDQDEVQGAEGWDKYLEQKTGVDGRSWLGKQGYLLIDEAQQSYWDSGLWATLFKAVEPAVSLPYIVLFTSYGSPTRGFSGFERKHMPTPMVFAADQQISLWPDANIEPPWRPIGLLLDEDEAIEVVERYAPCFIPNCAPILTQDLKRGLFKSSNGHIGLITSLVQALRSVPQLSSMARICKPVYWQTVSETLFRDPIEFFRRVQNLPFSRGLPPLAILQFPTITSVLKEAVVHDGLYRSSFRNKSEELQEALHNILANGWLHAENAGADEQFKFASQIHRWYCQCIFSEKHPDNQLNYVTPLELTLDAIRRFQPCQLAQASRSLAGNSRPLEDQYQKEFYRCLFPLLDGHVIMSPEFVIKSGTNGGTIDFLITQKKWGLELLRDRDRLQEHMDRFKPNGQYFTLIEKGKMDQYIVLNFTNIFPRKSHPEFKDHLYHVVFSEQYRKVTVIDASDLCEVDTFVLMENTN